MNVILGTCTHTPKSMCKKKHTQCTVLRKEANPSPTLVRSQCDAAQAAQNASNLCLHIFLGPGGDEYRIHKYTKSKAKRTRYQSRNEIKLKSRSDNAAVMLMMMMMMTIVAIIHMNER